jgi:hypothetical protein
MYAMANALPNVSRTINEDGHGYTTTLFRVTSNHWGYTWSYNCTGVGQYANVAMLIEDANGKPDVPNDLATVVIPDGNKYSIESGVEQAVQAGTYKIMVGTGCAWHIQVLKSAPASSSTLPGGVSVN